MIDSELLFLGIITICMVVITSIIVFSAIQHARTMNKVNAFITLGQNGLSTITQESSSLLKKVREQSQFLTSASIVLKTLSQFSKKNTDTKEDKMNNNNLLSFTLGAAMAGMSAYYVFKNKDDISNKIKALEETLADDYGELGNKAKEKLKEFLNGESVEGVQANELKLIVKKLDKLQKEIELLSVKS